MAKATDGASFKYRAFISYASRDRAAGAAFHRALERYVIPKPLRGRRTRAGVTPRRLTPIFRDRTDLQAGELGGLIREALEASQALVVLCSPHAAASPWVNEEIRVFKSLGREEQIVAVIVSGAPTAFDAEAAPDGAFPPALLRRYGPGGRALPEPAPEPFAPDLRPPTSEGGGDGLAFSVLKVAARLTDLPLDELTQRQNEVERRERRVVQAVAAAMLALALLAGAGGWVAWRQSQEATARLGDAIAMAARQIDTAIGARDLYGVPNRVVEQILTAARADFDTLTRDIGAAPTLRLERARLNLTFAELYETVGSSEGRVNALSRAEADLAALRSGVGSVPADLGARLGLLQRPRADAVIDEQIALYAAQAMAAVDRNDFDRAFERLAQAKALAAARLASDPSAPTRRQQARVLMTEGRLHYFAADLVQARAAFEAARGVLAALTAGPGAVAATDRLALVEALTELATTALEQDDRETALALDDQALALMRALADAAPEDADLKRRLLTGLARRADKALALGGDPAEVRALYREAEALSEALRRVDPLRADWRRDRSLILERSGSLDLMAGDFAAAEPALAEALDLLEGLLAAEPGDAVWLRDKTVVLERQGQLETARARMTEDPGAQQAALARAVAALATAAEIRTTLHERDRTDLTAKHDLAMALLPLAEAQTYLDGARAEAFATYAQALTLLAALAGEPTAPPGWSREHAIGLAQRAMAHAGGEDLALALADMEAAIAILAPLSKDMPEIGQFAQDLANMQAAREALAGALAAAETGSDPAEAVDAP